MIFSLVLKWLLGTRSGVLMLAASLLLAGLYTWHRLDKSSAVRVAVTRYIADVELSAAEAELAALKQRAAALEAANFQFQVQLSEAEALAVRQKEELGSYESTVTVVVDGALLERLRNR